MRLRHAGSLTGAALVDRAIDADIPLDVVIRTAREAESPPALSYAFRPPPPLYWRLDDAGFNLIEIGVDRGTGALRSFAAPLYRGALGGLDAAEEPDPSECAECVPRFDLAPWAALFESPEGRDTIRAEFHDVPGRCSFQLGGDTLRVVLFREAVSYRVDTGAGFVSEFNHAGELCAVTLKGLGDDEVACLRRRHKG
ncbi:MAG TPA: hypothetical protein VE642_01410 [Pyrinomonadaceae bacterium]|jgi:hypothetical protein|nr:hypothetical protein [Pyrinomonadaceae bacterium]